MQKDREADLLSRFGPYSHQYWWFQAAGWSAMAVLSYFSLTIWYNPGQAAPAAHTVLQSVLGIAVSHPLRWVGRATWRSALVVRVALNAAAILAASLVWTALRIQTFTALTGEVIPAEDWGGWLFASIIVFAAWSFCYHAFKYYRQSLVQGHLAAQAQNAALTAQARAQQEQFRRLEAEKLYRDAQLRMLKYQLNPHFFLNALNSVSALVSKDDKQAAMDMLARIGDFLRVSLAHPEEIQHTLSEELDALDIYLAIEKIRFGDRLRTEFHIDPAASNAVVPSLLLQPIFENAVKFAVGKRLAPTTIRFDARVARGRLHLRIADDGPGLQTEPDALNDGAPGIGLMNVRERLKSAYGDHFSFKLAEAEPHGVVIEIEIQLDVTGSGAPVGAPRAAQAG